MKNKYIRTSINEEIIDNYELFNYSLKYALKGSAYHWKLSLLLIHILLQNIFVKSLHSKSCYAYMKLKPTKYQPHPEIWHEDNYSNKILNFMNLFKAVKKQNNIGSRYDRLINKMHNEIRNRISHYDAKLHWSISIDLLIEMFRSSMEIVNLLIEKTNNIPMCRRDKARLMKAVKKYRKFCLGQHPLPLGEGEGHKRVG